MGVSARSAQDVRAEETRLGPSSNSELLHPVSEPVSIVAEIARILAQKMSSTW